MYTAVDPTASGKDRLGNTALPTRPTGDAPLVLYGLLIIAAPLNDYGVLLPSRVKEKRAREHGATAAFPPGLCGWSVAVRISRAGGLAEAACTIMLNS